MLLSIGYGLRKGGPVVSRVTSVFLLAVFLLAAIAPSSPAASAQAPSHYVVSRVGPTTYQAVEQNLGITYTGNLKSVVESAVADLDAAGSGFVTFQSGDFDLGADYFHLRGIDDITFQGQGIDVTIIRNFSSLQADTEVFNMGRVNRVVIRNLTVSAGGPFRSTSDAIDCDTCDDILIENVKVTSSRARGIIFDGKDNVADGDAVRNTVRNCIVVGVPGDGIELLASSYNTVEGCRIANVGGHGIQITKSSSAASQPNKKSNDNIVSGNYIENSGMDGINIIGSDRNHAIGNTILNSSDAVSGRDGIRIQSGNGITCDDNSIDQNLATDTQATKTQTYGLNIRDSACHRSVVGTNDFTGNRVGSINDQGTDTRYISTETPTPTSIATYTPTSLPSPTPSPSPSPAPSATPEGTATPTASPVPTATPTGTPGGGTFSFVPVADAYVHAEKPTVNAGSSLSLRADGSPDIRSYLRFEVEGLSGIVIHARLRLFANSSHSQGYDVREVADNGWGEDAITYDNAPAVGSVVASSGSFSAGAWTEVDVTALVSGNGTVGLAFTTGSSTGMNLASRETGATAPQLIIEAAAGPPTATPTISASHTPTATPTDTSTATVTATPTPTGTATHTPTSLPSPTPSPSPMPTATLEGTATPTASPVPTATPTGTPGGGTFSFAPVADAYVHAEKPTSNAGSSLSLRADGSPEVRSYLCFEVQGLTGTVVQARLRLFANSSHSQGYDVREVADNSWGEDTITYDNAPAVGSVVASSGSFSAGTWTEVDVTALVSGNGTVSLAFTTGSSTGMNLASRETSATAPQLILETQ